jgi:hypothetical protein
VLCVDEKSQIQALDRTQPGLPIKRGRCGTWTHDYVPNGTGTVSGRCFPRHRRQEFLRFLRQIDAKYGPELELHMVMDNYGTHKTGQVKRWLKHHPRFKVPLFRLQLVEHGGTLVRRTHRQSRATR